MSAVPWTGTASFEIAFQFNGNDLIEMGAISTGNGSVCVSWVTNKIKNEIDSFFVERACLGKQKRTQINQLVNGCVI